MRRRGITVLVGTGTLLAGRRVQVDGADGQTEISGRHVVLATGSVPRSLPAFAVDEKVILTSDGVLGLDSLPRSVGVIGGGAVGCEFASMFSDLGVQVTMLEALDTLLPGCDADIVARVARSFRHRGIAIHTGVEVRGHLPNGSATTLSFGSGQSITVDAVVVAVGRRPLTDGLLADGTGVTIDARGFIVVDELMRTTVDGVWAVGDVVNTPPLAHVAFAEGILTIKGILGEPTAPIDYSRVPWCLYCHPEVAFAGLTEAEARRRGIDISVKKYPMGGNSRAQILDDIDGVEKIVATRLSDGSIGPILGVHLVGPWATERISQGYAAVNLEVTPRHGTVHPAAPDPVGSVRRDGTGPDGKGTTP